jgi:hypothetical protein
MKQVWICSRSRQCERDSWNINESAVIGILDYAMALTTFGIVFLIGATLSVRFKVLSLFPAFGLAVVGTAVIGIVHGDDVGAAMVTIALVAAVLQIGYLSGLVTRTVIASFGMPERKAVMVGKLGHR